MPFWAYRPHGIRNNIRKSVKQYRYNFILIFLGGQKYKKSALEKCTRGIILSKK